VTTPAYLFEALKALRPVTRTFHDFQAPGTATAPWLVGNLQMPEPKPGLVANTHGATAVWRVTVAGATGTQALIVADEAEQAWSGARLDVDGWTCGALRPPRMTGPYAAGSTATDTNLRFQVITMEFDLTVSRLPVATP
jgi:hypothetical protein